MAAKNKGSNNLQALLEADGYNSADADQVAIPPHMSELSRPMLRRVRALKKVQLESLEVEAKFYQKVHELEKEFQPLFDAIGVKRRAIVTGEHEPEESEVELPLVSGVTPEELEKIENEAPVEGGEPSKGIPNFWYNTLQSVGNISDWIKENDEPVLKYLMDITTEVHDDPAGFTLNFHFAENPYFANQVLTKRYELDLEIDLEEPFEYDGPTVKKGEGCEIQWKEGKNVTQKTIKKKLKKGPQAGKYITKTVPNESFFTYFDPTAKTLEREMEPEEEERVREDFEIGQMLRDQVIPRAVLFYTGEAAEEDYDDFDDEEGDEDDEGNHSAGSEDEEE